MCKDQNNCLSCKIFFVCFDFNLMVIMFKVERGSKYRKNIESCTVLENIQSTFLRLKRLRIDLVKW